VADPGERSLDDPAFGKHDEAMQFVALDDRQLLGAGFGDSGRSFCSLIGGISEDTLNEGEEAARAPIEDEQSAVAKISQLITARMRSTSISCRNGRPS
jgi:hypothetical protein